MDGVPEYGRWPILQLSLFLVNVFQIPCALAPNFGTIVVCRALGGLSSAGGSVTLGMGEPDCLIECITRLIVLNSVADMWEPNGRLTTLVLVAF